MAGPAFVTALGILLAAANPWGSETSREYAKKAHNKRVAGDVAAARRIFEEGYREAQGNGNVLGQMKFLNSLGGCDYVEYRYQDGLRHWLEARSLAERHPGYDLEHGAVLFNLASLYFASANLDAAEEAAREGGDRLRQISGTPYYASQLHLIRAVIAAKRGVDSAAANDSFYRAAEAADLDKDDAGLSKSWNYAALARLANNDLDGAERYLLRAFLLRKMTRDPELISTYLGLATLYLAKGDLRLANSLADAAQRLATETNRPMARYQIHELRAKILARQQKRAEAHREYMRAIANIRYTRADLLPADLFRIHDEASLAGLYNDMLRNAMDWSRVDPAAPVALVEEAWLVAEEWKASVASGSDSDRKVARVRLTGKYWENLAELRQLEGRSVVLPGSRRTPTNGVEERLRVLRVRLAEMESYAGVRPFSGLIAENFATSKPLILFRDSLGPDSVLISFHLGPKVAIRWTLTKNRLDWKELPSQDRLAELTGMFSKAVRNAAESDRVRLGRELYEKLFGGLSSEALQAKHWLLAFDGTLLQLPVAALTETGEDGGTRYLIEARSLEIVAGAQALLANEAGDWSGLFVGVGDAVYNKADPRWVNNPGVQSRRSGFWGALMAAETAGGLQLPRLSSSRVELQASASAWGGSSRLLMGSDASRQNTVEAIESGASVVHFATHFLQKDTSPDRALLVLSLDASGQPDFFSPPDAVHVKVPDSLVVLSGCHSAAGTQVPAAGLIGMTRAWLLAGARGVIASLWPTPDDTGAIFQTFYRELQKEALSSNGGGVSKKTAARKQRGMSLRIAAEALRRAQLEMLRTQTWRIYAEILGHVSIDRANDLTMKPPPPSRDPENTSGGGSNNSKPEVTQSVGGTGAAMARSSDSSEASLEALGPEEGLRVLSDSWREDPASGGSGEGESGEYHDLRSFIWTQLVARLQTGDPKAMEELYGMFSNGVRYYLCRQLGPEELEDRLHDAFLVVVDSIRAGELRDPRRLMGFIRTVVKRMVAATIDKQITARRERIDEEKTSNVSDKRVTPEGALLFQQQTNIVREVLREMSERDRQVLTRFYVEEQSPQQICEDMNLTMTQFRLLKSRAKNRFGELGKKKVQKSGLSQVFMRFSGS